MRRAAVDVRLLRELIAMVDNAQAVPMAGRPTYVVPGDDTDASDAARLPLTRTGFGALGRDAVEERRDCARMLRSLGRADEAADAEREAETLMQYVDLVVSDDGRAGSAGGPTGGGGEPE